MAPAWGIFSFFLFLFLFLSGLAGAVGAFVIAVIVWITGVLIYVLIIANLLEDNRKSKLTSEELAEEKQRRDWDREDRKEINKELALLERLGSKNQKIVCPHCQKAGFVRTKIIMQDKGIHGSKVAAAVITGGITVLAGGLSRKEQMTKAHCENCNSDWVF